MEGYLILEKAMNKRRKGLLLSQEMEVVRLYEKRNADGTRKYTQSEIASRFFVAPVTIRRALAERGVITLAGYMTRNQTMLLEYLAKKNVKDESDAIDLFSEINKLNNILDKHEIADLNALEWTLSGSQP